MKEAIEDIKRVSKEYLDGDSPTWRDMEEYGNRNPETYTIRNDCKWNDLLEAAEKEVNRKPTKKDNIDREVLLDEIERIGQEEYGGRCPTVEEFENHSDYNLYYCDYGGWVSLLKDTDLFYQPQNHGDTYKQEEIENELYSSMKEHGSSLLFFQVDLSSASISHRYESFFDALVSAGLEDIIIQEISELAVQDTPPTEEEFRSCDDTSTCRLYKIFGRWNNALEAAGFNLNKRHGIKDGSNYNYGSSWTEKLKKKIREREDSMCGVCGFEQEKHYDLYGQKLPVHHIKSHNYFHNKEWFDIQNHHHIMNSSDNLVALCLSCHGKLEGKWIDSKADEFKRLGRNLLDIQTTTENRDSVFDY